MQSCLNLPGPSGKAKYYLATDSELVPRGKGEKQPGEGGEIDLKPYAYKESERGTDLVLERIEVGVPESRERQNS